MNLHTKFFGKLKWSKKYFNLQARLIISYLTVIIIPLPLIAVFSYSIINSFVQDRFSRSIEQTIIQVNKNIRYDMAKVVEISETIYINPVTQSVLMRQDEASLSEVEQDVTQLRKILDSFTSNSKVYTASVYYHDVGQYPYGTFESKFMSDLILKNDDNFKSFYENKDSIRWFIVPDKDGKNAKVTLLRTIIDLRSSAYIGTLMLQYDEKNFNDIINDVEIGYNGFLFVVDDSGKLLSHKNRDMVFSDISDRGYIQKIIGNESGNFLYKADGNEYQFVYNAIVGTDWKVIGVVNTKEIKAEIRYIPLMTIALVVICVILSLFFSIYISGRLSKRVRALVEAMKQIENGEFNYYLPADNTHDEIRTLHTGFKSMVHRIVELIDKNNISNRRKREAELKALYEQINPHFLYNTLDSINWTAATKYGAKDISIMVTSLAKLFRLSLNKGSELTTVGNEIEYIKNYINIQKMRYDDKFDVDILTDPKLSDVEIIKLILQPFVENSISHGFDGITYKGIITVRCEAREDGLCLTVSDNGVGCDVDKLNKAIRDNLYTEDKTEGYGIRNVDERLKMYYGEEFGVIFTKNEDKGITAHISIPVSGEKKL